jgi:hypothetical protein
MTRADLIERLEKASGPDRELDARIWAHLAGVKYVSHCAAYAGYGAENHLTQVEFKIPPARKTQVTTGRHYPHATPVTGSIDAVVALVERELPEWYISILIGGEGLGKTAAYVRDKSILREDKTEGEGYHAAPAIALCIALLKALEAQEDNHG